jgi:hypothetical protein
VRPASVRNVSKTHLPLYLEQFQFRCAESNILQILRRSGVGGGSRVGEQSNEQPGDAADPRYERECDTGIL